MGKDINMDSVTNFCTVTTIEYFLTSSEWVVCTFGMTRSSEIMQRWFQSQSGMNVESHGLFVMLLLPKQKRYCNEYAEKCLVGGGETHGSCLTGDVGEVQRAGHRQEEEDRQLHGVVLLVRRSAPAAFCYYRLFSWRGQYAQRDGTEVPISSGYSLPCGKQALCCALTKSRDPVWGRV